MLIDISEQPPLLYAIEIKTVVGARCSTLQIHAQCLRDFTFAACVSRRAIKPARDLVGTWTFRLRSLVHISVPVPPLEISDVVVCMKGFTFFRLIVEVL